MSSVERDIKTLTSSTRRYQNDAIFLSTLEPWLADDLEKHGRVPAKPVNVNEELRRRQVKKAEELVAFDKEYRNILSTVAALGASIDAFKVQRYAVGVALMSLIVALITLASTAAGSAKTVDFLFIIWRWIATR